MIELWKPVKGFEGGYEVSDLGNVRSLPRWVDKGKRKRKIKGCNLKKCFDGVGYYKVTMSFNGKSRQVNIHILVAETFMNMPKNIKGRIVVDHINGIKTDNRLINLRYITNRENISINRNVIYTGVRKNSKNRWKSTIQINKQVMYLGVYKTPEEARDVYLNALSKHNKSL